MIFLIFQIYLGHETRILKIFGFGLILVEIDLFFVLFSLFSVFSMYAENSFKVKENPKFVHCKPVYDPPFDFL